MAKPQNVKIIAFVGLAGTGRSAATVYLTDRGIPKVSFGTIIMNALVEAGLDPTVENERTLREKLRLDPSGDVVVNRAIAEIQALIDSGQHKIVLDGLGSWDAYKRFKHEFPGSMIIVAFTAQRHIRIRRLAGRAEHPLTETQISERDYDEIETLNKGGVIALADRYVFDNGSLEQLHTQLDELFRELEF